MLDAAVIGLPDEKWGEIVAAAVRLREPLADPAEELTAWCRERMAPYKVPARFVVVNACPMTPSGKVQKFRLREELTGSRDAGS